VSQRKVEFATDLRQILDFNRELRFQLGNHAVAEAVGLMINDTTTLSYQLTTAS
jgi:hypothetical protein